MIYFVDQIWVISTKFGCKMTFNLFKYFLHSYTPVIRLRVQYQISCADKGHFQDSHGMGRKGRPSMQHQSKIKNNTTQRHNSLVRWLVSGRLRWFCWTQSHTSCHELLHDRNDRNLIWLAIGPWARPHHEWPSNQSHVDWTVGWCTNSTQV